MTAEDIAVVQAVAAAAGERFRSFADARIAACADHPPVDERVLLDFVGDRRAWVATSDGVVVGFAVAGTVGDCAHLGEVAVDPAHGRQGHATALLDTVVAWAGERGLPAVTLTTFRDVPFNRPLYERRGFRVLDDDELSAEMAELMVEEEQSFGLARELRVAMRREVAAPVTVRDATVEDLPVITALFNALLPTTTIAWREHLADEPEMAEWFAVQSAAGHPVLVAQVAGQVVGYTTWAGFRYSERFPGYRHSMELTIHVDGDFHGRGIGRELISALVKRARASGVHVLVAGADADNTASIEFHRRVGFVEVARMPEVGRKFGRWLDLVLMQRVVEDGRL